MSVTSATSPSFPIQRIFTGTHATKNTKAKKVAEPLLSQTPAQTTKKFEHPLSAKNTLKKAFASKIEEIPRLASRNMHFIYAKVQKSLPPLFAIKKNTSRLHLLKQKAISLKQENDPTNKELIMVNQEIEVLRQQKKKLVNRLLEFRKAPPDFFGVVSTCISAIYTAGAYTKGMSSQLLTGLHATTSWIGCISGGIAILFGGVEIFLGVQKLRDSSMQLKELAQSNTKFKEECDKLVPENLSALWVECRNLQQKRLLVEGLKAQKNRTKALFQVIAGSFAIVGGAIGIASACTAGWAAFGFAIAAGFTGAAGIGVGICSFLRTRPLKKQIEAIRTFTQKDLEELSHQIQNCTDKEKEQLADLLGVDHNCLVKTPSTTLQVGFLDVLSKQERN